MTFTLAGIGTAVPQHSITQEDAARHSSAHCCDTSEDERRLQWLYRRSGVRSRHSVLLETSEPDCPNPQSFFPPRSTAPHGPTTAERMRLYHSEALPLACRAARAALDDARLHARDVTHLVTVSCTGFSAPGVDIGLIRELSLPACTSRTHIGYMGCHGALNGLRIANALLAAEPSARVLLCAVELCSLHHQYGWRADHVLANALFADGAAAVVGQSAGSSCEETWRLKSSASTVLPETMDLMSWQIGDHGFEMTLSPEVPILIEERLHGWITPWLASCGLSLDDVGSWAIHPGGPKILQATAAAAGFDRSQLADSEEVLAKYGNMSSPTILFILDRLRRRNAPRPCVGIAFGPGLTIEAALFV